jgi:hypothetical protein
MLILGIIGAVLCVASVMLFGLDITRFISEGNFIITSIGTVLQLHFPSVWKVLADWAVTMPPGDIKVQIVSFITSISASLIGIIIGAVLVVVGFRIKRGAY